MAADMAVKARPPVAPIAGYNWNGWYAGVNGGWAWGNSSGYLDSFSTAPPAVNFTPAVTAGGTPRSLGATHEGGVGGGQIGYNWQMNSIVLGLEADLNYVSAQNASNAAYWLGATNSTGGLLGTARARLGLALDRWLIYGTGGFAYGQVDAFGFSNTATGWTAGGGVAAYRHQGTIGAVLTQAADNASSASSGPAATAAAARPTWPTCWSLTWSRRISPSWSSIGSATTAICSPCPNAGTCWS